jgi:hypothetical protein
MSRSGMESGARGIFALAAALALSSPAFAQVRSIDDVAVKERAPELSDQTELLDALSTSADGLVQEAVPGGGVRIHLQGRFRQVVFARVDERGEVSVDHQLPLALWLALDSGGACREADAGAMEAGDARP